MDDEKLIKLVRQHPVLYDPSNTKYMDTKFKNTLWCKLGSELKATPTLCKTRWANIRDNFRKSMKKSKTASGQNGKTVKMYKYSEQLNFLINLFDDKDTTSHIEDYIEVINQDVTCEELVSPKNEDNTQNCATEGVFPVIVESQSLASSKIKQKCQIPRKKARHALSKDPYPKTPAATVLEHLVKINEVLGSSTLPPQHPVDAFLSGIAPALKKLPPRYWHYAKSDMFAAVQKYELKMLSDPLQFSESTSAPTYSEQLSPAGSNQYTSYSSTPVESD